MKIGDRIWLKKARDFWFKEVLIVGETTRSWVTIEAEGSAQWLKDDGQYQQWYVERHSKKLPKNLKNFIQADAGLAKLTNWALSERYRIGSAVEHCTDPAILLAVSKLVGHKQPEGI
jgi:hypothetical protein